MSDLLEFARRYTEAWCSGEPRRVAEHYSIDGSLTIASTRVILTPPADEYLGGAHNLRLSAESAHDSIGTPSCTHDGRGLHVLVWVGHPPCADHCSPDCCMRVSRFFRQMPDVKSVTEQFCPVGAVRPMPFAWVTAALGGS